MSEEQKEPKKRIVTDLKYPLPDVRPSLERQLDIIKAYVIASNNGKEAVGYKELESVITIDSSIVSGCNKFFQHLGLLQPSDKVGKNTPTELAMELYNGIKWKNESATKSTLRKILTKSWFWNLTKQILDVNGSTTHNALVEKLGLSCGGDPQKHARSLDKLIEYMSFAELIKEEGGNITSNIELTEEIKSPLNPQEATEQTTPQNQETLPVGNTINTMPSINISVSLMINSETSEDQIRKTIRTIVDELEKIQSERRGKGNGTE